MWDGKLRRREEDCGVVGIACAGTRDSSIATYCGDFKGLWAKHNGQQRSGRTKLQGAIGAREGY
jgi:hypothetical protein